MVAGLSHDKIQLLVVYISKWKAKDYFFASGLLIGCLERSFYGYIWHRKCPMYYYIYITRVHGVDTFANVENYQTVSIFLIAH